MVEGENNSRVVLATQPSRLTHRHDLLRWPVDGVNCGEPVIDATGRTSDAWIMTSPQLPHRVVILAFDKVQSLDVAGPAEVFATANGLLAGQSQPDDAYYDVAVASARGGVVPTESAIQLVCEPVDALGGPIDTLILPGGFAVLDLCDDADFISIVDKLIARCRRLVTVCSGTYLAAAAGALDGHTVTTHWARANRLAELHPEVAVDADPIFIHSPGRKRDVWSSAGVTAGIDLSLALVEHDVSTDLAQEAARWLVMYLRRPGGQSQFASPTWIRQAPEGPIRHAQDLIVRNPAADLRVASIAASVGLSERHFVRRFTAEVGLAPAKFVAHVRVDAARHELERSTDTVAAIADRCGFGTAETLRRTLHRHIGVSPEGYRQRFSHVQSSRPVLNQKASA